MGQGEAERVGEPGEKRKYSKHWPAMDREGESVEKRECIEPAGISPANVIFFSGSGSDDVPRLP